jgi:hypothetical protein
VVSFTPRPLYPHGGPGTHLIGGWVGLRDGLDTVSKKKIHSSFRESNPDHPIVHLIANRYTDVGIAALGDSLI